MDAQERLRLALRTVGCSRCGEPYLPDGVQILAQRETIAFVRLECSHCSTQILALVTGTPTEDEGIEHTEWTAVDRPLDLGRGDAGPTDRSRADRPPIDEGDVREMRDFLDGYQGDLRSLLIWPHRTEDP